MLQLNSGLKKSITGLRLKEIKKKLILFVDLLQEKAKETVFLIFPNAGILKT